MSDHLDSIWNFTSTVPTPAGDDLVGYTVVASDGDVGKVDECSNETDEAHFVVDVGFWIFGKRRLIPAGVVIAIDHAARRVSVNMTKDQIRDAPDWDAGDDAVTGRADQARYYGPYGL